MNRLLRFIILSLLLSINAFADVKKGNGEVTMSTRAVETFIQYIQGKKSRSPTGFILSSDGYWANYHYCPRGKSCADTIFARSITVCEEQTGLECYIFARRYTVLWKNGINPGKGKNSKFKSKWSDDQIRAKLTELGFLGGSTSSNKTMAPKTTKKIDSKKYTDGLAYFSECAWSPDEKDFLHSYEVNLKKKTIDEEFFAEGEIYKSRLKIIQNNDDFIKTKIEVYGKSFNQYIFNKKNNEITFIGYKDKQGKTKTEKYILFCKDIFGTLKNPEIEKKVTKKKLSNTDKDIVKKLKDLKDLLDSGVLTKEEFQKAKKKILN